MSSADPPSPYTSRSRFPSPDPVSVSGPSPNTRTSSHTWESPLSLISLRPSRTLRRRNISSLLSSSTSCSVSTFADSSVSSVRHERGLYRSPHRTSRFPIQSSPVSSRTSPSSMKTGRVRDLTPSLRRGSSEGPFVSRTVVTVPRRVQRKEKDVLFPGAARVGRRRSSSSHSVRTGTPQ